MGLRLRKYRVTELRGRCDYTLRAKSDIYDCLVHIIFCETWLCIGKRNADAWWKHCWQRWTQTVIQGLHSTLHTRIAVCRYSSMIGCLMTRVNCEWPNGWSWSRWNWSRWNLVWDWPGWQESVEVSAKRGTSLPHRPPRWNERNHFTAGRSGGNPRQDKIWIHPCS